ncbi:MAG: hypothetical protein HEQ38_09465 [Gemmatimonas sp.]|nr:hypothetical protein [Gemmatimonas sp.]
MTIVPASSPMMPPTMRPTPPTIIMARLLVVFARGAGAGSGAGAVRPLSATAWVSATGPAAGVAAVGVAAAAVAG